MDRIDLGRMRIYCADGGLGVLIFTGIGGSLDGYRGKYNIIAARLVEKYRVSVFVVAVESWSDFDRLFEWAMEEVEAYYRELGLEDFGLYVMGVSAGGNMVASKAYEYAQIRKVLSVNPVLQINYHRLWHGIENSRADLYFVFGDQDPSAGFVPLIFESVRENVKIDILENVDHQFTQSFDLFLSLPERYFFGNDGT